MRKRYYILFILLFAVLSLPAQREKTKTVTATGTYVGNENETMNEIKAKALQKAKKEALKEAGVPEKIRSTTILLLNNDSTEFYEISTEVDLLELEGRLGNVEVIDEKREYKDNYTLYSVTIRAEVKVEEIKNDPDFDFETSGFKDIYHSGEKMHFTIKPTRDCNLRIFYFGEDTSDNAQIYPMKDVFKDLPFKADVPVQFPPEDPMFLYNTVFEYSMDFSNKNMNKDKISERGIILIVALKNDKHQYRFTRKNADRPLTKKEVFTWLSSIDNDQKRVALQVVHIIRK